ncbi:glycosyltransferase family 87 protein [Roseibium sediminis]|uniref:glycosyltransferase family 87 protein n=1 Tax=Roseibium sediminis TaxID=1775174 RepID=UPI00123D3D47|nr:glycosyltransferase family 87 protein [Roseibium sediminis]
MNSSNFSQRLQSTFKTGDWVSARHIRFASLFYLFASGLFVAALFLVPNSFNPGAGKPLLTDFLSFWAAAAEAVAGRPELPFDTAEFQRLQNQLTGTDSFFSFFYPPTFLLGILPFGLADFSVSFLLFNGLGLVCLWAMIRAVTGSGFIALMLCAFPPVMNCVFHGQNAMFLAALLGFALLCLRQGHAVIAGILIGLMTVKPQLGVLIPIALLADRRWITILSAGVTTLALAGLSYLVFGQETWLAFIEQIPMAGQTLQEGWVPWEKMISFYAGLRTMGVAHAPAQILQGLVAIGAGILVFWAWRSSASYADKVMVLVPFSLLATPFALSYDLTLLVVPIAFWLAETEKQGARPYEKSLLVICVLLTAAGSSATKWTGVPVGFLAICAVAYIGVQRVLFQKGRLAAG